MKMPRRRMKKLFTTLVAFVAVAGIEPAWSASDGPLFSVQSLGNGVHVVFGDGGNVSVAEVGDSLLVVDSKIDTDSEALKRQIKAISSNPISIITNTHWHYDHVGGNEALGGGVIPILAHDKVRERMAKGQRCGCQTKTPSLFPATAGLPTRAGLKHTKIWFAQSAPKLAR
ncbi:MAG: glyoxylase-like metal-dependent hydrolase (beta-lactamase superfamily II) [Gammaproteobacteria bacterium]|jgi:glyoxylase-like metal-dependent hydrolase (beta-lactamase superfamily II)